MSGRHYDRSRGRSNAGGGEESEGSAEEESSEEISDYTDSQDSEAPMGRGGGQGLRVSNPRAPPRARGSGTVHQTHKRKGEGQEGDAKGNKNEEPDVEAHKT